MKWNEMRPNPRELQASISILPLSSPTAFACNYFFFLRWQFYAKKFAHFTYIFIYKAIYNVKTCLHRTLLPLRWSPGAFPLAILHCLVPGFSSLEWYTLFFFHPEYCSWESFFIIAFFFFYQLFIAEYCSFLQRHHSLFISFLLMFRTFPVLG